MKRLIEDLGENSSQGYDKIFKQRLEKGVDGFDMARWRALVSKFGGGKLIDLGCLDSQVPIMAKKKYPQAEVWGIDEAIDTIKFLNEVTDGIHYQIGDVYDTKFPNHYFDYAVAGELIEHLDKPVLFFREVDRILRKGGMLALSTPLEEQGGEVDGQRHVWSYTKEDILNLWKPYGGGRIKTLRSQYFPKYVYHFPHLIAYLVKD